MKYFIILLKIENFIILPNTVKKNRFDSNKDRNIKKNRNKILKIVAKCQNLPKFRLKICFSLKTLLKFKLLVL